MQSKPLGYVLLGIAYICFTAARNMINLEGGYKVIGIACGVAFALAVVAGLNYIMGTAPLPVIASEPPPSAPVSPPPLPESASPERREGSALAFEVTKTNTASMQTKVSFRVPKAPPGPVKIELNVRCHGCQQHFGRSEAYDYGRTSSFSTRRECPHCGADMTFVLQFSPDFSGFSGTLLVTGETHMTHQTPSSAGVEIVSITASGDPSAAERVFQLIRQGAQELPTALIDRLENVNIADEEGVSLLSRLCNKYTPEEITLVIQRGADLHHRSPGGVFPLLAAVTSYKIENVKALLDAGVDVNRHANRSGVTALHQAVYSTSVLGSDAAERRKNSKVIALMLLDAGANPNTRDQGGDSPLSEVNASLEDRDGTLRSRLEAATKRAVAGG